MSDSSFVQLRTQRYPYLVPVQQISGTSSLHDTKPIDAPTPMVEDVRALDANAETERLRHEHWIMMTGMGILGLGMAMFLFGH